MLFKQILFFLILTSFFSCENNSKLTQEQDEKLTDTLSEIKLPSKQVNIQKRKIKLNTDAEKVVGNWKEYVAVAEFIPKFYKSTTTEILSNSQQLLVLSRQLKDSIRVKKFDKHSFRIRLNVFYNETMRLADMDSIPNITQKEIIQENNNIAQAFSAINAKINAMVNKEKLETDLKEFDSVFKFKDSIEENENKTTIKKNPNEKRKIIKKRIQPLKQNHE
jgi:hypothetical protein